VASLRSAIAARQVLCCFDAVHPRRALMAVRVDSADEYFKKNEGNFLRAKQKRCVCNAARVLCCHADHPLRAATERSEATAPQRILPLVKCPPEGRL